MAAELPLRGKLRAEAKTFSIDERTLKVIYRCFCALSTTCKSSRLFNPVTPELPRARRMGKTERQTARVQLGAYFRPRIRRRALRALPLHPRASTFSALLVTFGAARRQTPISRVSHYC